MLSLLAKPALSPLLHSPLLQLRLFSHSLPLSSKYPQYGGKKLPSYILPKLSRKSQLLTHSLKMKFFRLKRGKTQRRPIGPSYGRDDFCLSKMNI
ncbi:hypothetical protein HDV03_003849 [Kappamyces sp. JEL0829]|nr:hypothetical protein HDV03_003849 [Kappamyces sp. JEL0829]